MYCPKADASVAVYQGNSIPAINGRFTKIPNDENFVAIGTASDKFDRYSTTPHASYEFKIPLDVIGRSNNYGFYISAYDTDPQNHYSWPYDIKKNNLYYQFLVLINGVILYLMTNLFLNLIFQAYFSSLFH